jgi:hypothetical protein
MTPAMTVLPRQDSMPICICHHQRRVPSQRGCETARRVLRTAFTICCSCSDIPALGFMAPDNMPGLPGKEAMVDRGGEV